MKTESEGTTGEDLRKRTFAFGCEVVALHRLIYRSGPDLRDVSRLLEEADAAQSRPDFISKCNIALKEARESRY